MRVNEAKQSFKAPNILSPILNSIGLSENRKHIRYFTISCSTIIELIITLMLGIYNCAC